MNREQKTALVEELAEQIRAADTIFAVDYRGISVEQAAELRSRLRDANTRFRVVKNSLTERATDAAGVGELKVLLEGPTALAFVAGDAALAAKALNDAARTLGTLEFKGGLMAGTALSAEDIRSIARLPSRDVLNSQLVGTIVAPLSGLVRGLNALIAGIAIQLKAIADQGLVSGEAPSPSAEPPSEPEGEAAAVDASSSEEDGASPAEEAPASEGPEAAAEAPTIDEPEAQEAVDSADPSAQAEASPEQPETEASGDEEPEAEKEEA